METAMRNVSINDRTNTPNSKDDLSSSDQPLDFSKRVEKSFEKDTLRKVSEDSAVGLELPAERAVDGIQRSAQIPISSSVPTIASFLPQHHAALASMGMFYPSAPVFPNLIPPGFPNLWQNQMAAAAFLHQQEAAKKFLQQTALNKPGTSSPFIGGRPFLNKDGLPNPVAAANPLLSGARFPGMNPAPIPTSNGSSNPVIPDPTLLAEALRSHEEMFNAYKQQVLNQKASEEGRRGRKHGAVSASSTAAAHNGSGSNGELHNAGGAKARQPEYIYDKPSTETFAAVTSPNGSHLDKDDDDDEDNESVASMVTSTNNERLMGGDDLSAELAENGSRMSVDVDEHSNQKPLSAAAAAVTSSNESLATSDHAVSRRSLTPSLSTSEYLEFNAMRPRSSTLPTQICESRKLSCSPAPSHLSNGYNSSGPGTPNSKGAFRKRARTLPEEQKDDAYWERRRKNNEAAKRSRDSRRAKEDEIAIRAAFLEQENLRLRVELAALRQQTAKLRSELIIIQGPDETPQSKSSDGA